MTWKKYISKKSSQSRLRCQKSGMRHRNFSYHRGFISSTYSCPTPVVRIPLVTISSWFPTFNHIRVALIETGPFAIILTYSSNEVVANIWTTQVEVLVPRPNSESSRNPGCGQRERRSGRCWSCRASNIWKDCQVERASIHRTVIRFWAPNS